MYKKTLYRLFFILNIIFFSLTNCSQPGSNSNPPSVFLYFTNISYDSVSGCLTGTTNALPGKTLIFECNGKTAKSVVENNKVSFYLDGNIVKHNADGGKTFPYVVRCDGYPNFVADNFVFLPVLNLEYKNKIYDRISCHLDLKTVNIFPELVANYDSSYLNVKKNFYIADDLTAEQLKGNISTQELASSAFTYISSDSETDGLEKLQNKVSEKDQGNRYVNIGKYLVCDYEVTVKGHEDIKSNVSCIWIMNEDVKADSIQIKTLDGVVFYVEFYKDGQPACAEGDIKWYVDENKSFTAPVSESPIYQLRQEDCGKYLKASFVQNYDGSSQPELTAVYQRDGVDAKVYGAIKEVVISFVGDAYCFVGVLKTGQSPSEKLKVSRVTDNFDQELDPSKLSFDPAVKDSVTGNYTAIDWKNCKYPASTNQLVLVNYEGYFPVTASVYIPVYAAIKCEEYDMTPQLSRDVYNINTDYVRFYKICENMVYRIGEEDTWKPLTYDMIPCYEGDVIEVKIKAHGELGGTNFVGESEIVKIVAEKPFCGTATTTSGMGLANLDNQQLTIDVSEVTLNLYRLTPRLPESLLNRIQNSSETIEAVWSIDNAQAYIDGSCRQDGYIYTVDGRSWPHDTYTAKFDVIVNTEVLYTCSRTIKVR